MHSNNIFIEKNCICTVLTLLLSSYHNQYNIDYREHLYYIMEAVSSKYGAGRLKGVSEWLSHTSKPNCPVLHSWGLPVEKGLLVS